MTLIKIKDYAPKRKWMNKFLIEYHQGNENVWNYEVNPIDSYFVGYFGHREIGYISIRDLRDEFLVMNKNGKVLKCAFVEPNRRSRGYMKQMISIALEKHDVKMIEIERATFERNRSYYADLGLTEFGSNPDETLGYCYSAEFGLTLRNDREGIFPEASNDNARKNVLRYRFAA